MSRAQSVGHVGQELWKHFRQSPEIFDVVYELFLNFIPDIPDTPSNTLPIRLFAVGDSLNIPDTTDAGCSWLPEHFFPVAEAPRWGARIGGAFVNHPFRQAPEGLAATGENLCH
jgi:hypothetical protein